MSGNNLCFFGDSVFNLGGLLSFVRLPYGIEHIVFGGEGKVLDIQLVSGMGVRLILE